MDIAGGEKVEGELDILITRRHEQRVRDEGERAAEELWRVSARIHEAKQQREKLEAWRCYHEDQAASHRRTLEALIAKHEEAAQMLEDDEPSAGGDDAP